MKLLSGSMTNRTNANDCAIRSLTNSTRKQKTLEVPRAANTPVATGPPLLEVLGTTFPDFEVARALKTSFSMSDE